jgi:TolB-like protein
LETPFPAYRGDEPYIFVCYSHEDAAVVFPELSALRDSGIHIYYDEGIAPGHEWTQELADAIDNASRVLYFVSPASVRSRHCRNEVQYALGQEQPVVAVYLEPTDLPGGLKLSLGSTQAILRYELGAQEYARKLRETLTRQRPVGDAPATPKPIARRGRRGVVVTLLAVLVLTVAVGWWFFEHEPAIESTSNSGNEVPTVAVLPFVNMSGDPSQEFFSDGVAEDILTGLARQRGLVVRARQSSFLFKGRQTDPREIAEALDVRYLVNGSVRSEGGRVRVTVRLTDTETNTDIWSSPAYDRDLADVFAVQDEITESVVGELGVRFSAFPRRAVAAEAYEAFLRGRDAFYRQRFASAQQDLLAAIELEPDYADAHAQLAQVYATEAWNSPANLHELLSRSQKETAAALDLDPDQPLARGMRAMELPIQPAINELHALVEQYPNDGSQLFFYSTRMRQIGRRDLEMAIMDRSVELLPPPLPCWPAYIDINLFYARLPEARRALERCEASGIPYPLGWAQLAVLEGDLMEARRQAARPPSDWRAVPDFWRPIWTAIVSHAENDPDGITRALATIQAERDQLPLFTQSVIALVEGKTKQALTLYRAALEYGEPIAFHYIQGQALNRLLFPEFYANERYNEMLEVYGLDAASIAKLDVPPLPF